MIAACLSTPDARHPRPRCDVAVVGAGAAGLAAAIFAAEAAGAAGYPARIVLLDGAKRIGAKILVSGGGRCNVTHEEVRAEDFNGEQRAVRNVLAAFDADAAVRWFASLGVPLKREPTGKLFPVSDRARDVLDALVRRCDELGVEVLTEHRVVDLSPMATPRDGDPRRGFLVRHTRGELFTRRVIMATGGRSLPRTGSDGGGLEILRRLGHTVTDTYPALVPVVLDQGMFHAQISGVSHEAELTVAVEGKRADRRAGSLLWTHFGISGPVVIDASRHWLIAHAQGKQVELRCNFLPGRSLEQIEGAFVDGAVARPRSSVGRLLADDLPTRLATVLVQHAGIEPSLQLAQLPRGQRRSLCRVLTALPLPVVRDRGWNYAEVTAGGVPLDEIDTRTMQSRRVPGLYLAGELLDCDGRIGGFNFQWAWATGCLAGRAAGTTS